MVEGWDQCRIGHVEWMTISTLALYIYKLMLGWELPNVACPCTLPMGGCCVRVQRVSKKITVEGAWPTHVVTEASLDEIME